MLATKDRKSISDCTRQREKGFVEEERLGVGRAERCFQNDNAITCHEGTEIDQVKSRRCTAKQKPQDSCQVQFFTPRHTLSKYLQRCC